MTVFDEFGFSLSKEKTFIITIYDVEPQTDVDSYIEEETPVFVPDVVITDTSQLLIFN